MKTKPDQVKKIIEIYGAKVPVKIFKHNESNAHFMGYCSKKPLEIYLNPYLKGEDVIQTLNHEIIHAFIFRLGLDQILSHDTQEFLAENLGNFISENYKMKP